MRLTKIVGTGTGAVEHKYVWQGGRLISEQYGNNTLEFYYDESGNPLALRINGGIFYYVTNLQGDVVALVTNTGQVKAEYEYDAYGNLLSSSGAIAAFNPLRYRGYYYDTETGFYYLQSRYYDPEICRFINADGYASTGQGFIGTNMFAYCGNNPVNGWDPNGNRAVLYDVSTNKKSKNDNTIDITERMDELMAERAGYYSGRINEINNMSFDNFYNISADQFEAIKCGFYFSIMLEFALEVRDGGKLDLKNDESWAFDSEHTYIYNGMELRYDDPGNIVFGYVGATIFPKEILCFGAGVNQIKKFGFAFGDLSTFYDDPRDNEMIKYGYDLYMERRINGK